MRCRWKQLRQTVFSASNINGLIDSVAILTAEARGRHFQQWPVLGQYVWPNPSPIATTYEGEIQTLKTWLTARIDWLDKNIPNKGDCVDYPSNVDASFIITNLPNPFTDGNNISIQSRTDQQILITISDMLGRQVQSKLVNVSPGYNNVAIAAAYWSRGIYFISFTTANGEKVTKRIIK
jgi:hypothetical protein